MSDTIFHKIIKNEIPVFKVWEDADHLAFLTPFPNTPGFTVLIPKVFPGDYIFSVDDEVYIKMLRATRTVAKILEKAFNTPRVALVFEGTGVAYVHAKIIPLHGELAGKTNVWSKNTEFHPEYQGHLTTVEGPKMSDEELATIQEKIINAQKK